MPLVPLSDDFIDSLLAKPEPVSFRGVPVLTKEETEWREINYNRDNWVETFPCNFCGCCPTPGKCVRSVQCPLCWRPAGFSCIRPDHPSVIEPYHEMRWQLVKERHGTYYK